MTQDHEPNNPNNDHKTRNHVNFLVFHLPSSIFNTCFQKKIDGHFLYKSFMYQIDLRIQICFVWDNLKHLEHYLASHSNNVAKIISFYEL